MTYINAISSISFQDFLEDKSIAKLKKLSSESTLIEPNYKQWIKAMQLRRMSKIVKMGIACTKDIMSQLGLNENSNYFDSIIVGTGLGCIKDTIKFLNVINSVSTNSIPPTAFIQSTHNTIAGQIALLLSNNSYNMTYVQNGVSFEQALLDAQLKILEGKKNVLVGAVDEMIDYLRNLAILANIKELESYTEGSAFFALSNIQNEKTKATLCKTMSTNCPTDFNIDKSISDFLATENLHLEDIDIVLESSPKFMKNEKYHTNFSNKINYENYCGKYFTSSGFAMYLACILFGENIENINKTFDINISQLKYVLIVNNYIDRQIGYTLLKK